MAPPLLESERENCLKAAASLEAKDNFGRSKDNFVFTKDKNDTCFCLSWYIRLSLGRTNKEEKLSLELPNLRNLQFSPHENPFMRPTTLEINHNARRRYVRTANQQELVDPTTGEVHAISMIHTVEARDEASFVKVFADGVKAAFELKAAGMKVFQAVLAVYEQEKMSKGFADSLSLFWFDGGLEGATIGISEKTFHRGLKELIAKGFLQPKQPNIYWVNPALFFKGDRVAFVKEYRRLSAPATITQGDNNED